MQSAELYERAAFWPKLDQLTLKDGNDEASEGKSDEK
jgi:hypothetical protein